MRKLIILSLLSIIMLLSINTIYAGDNSHWLAMIGPWPDDFETTPPMLMLSFGVVPDASDGSDIHDMSSGTPYQTSVNLAPYHVNGPDWSKLTGFYVEDWKSPIDWGTSKTWSSIYLWIQGISAPDNKMKIFFSSYDSAPPGYTAKLTLDYVPESLGWIGPMEL